MTTTTTDARIYVACLSCYNAGRLVGAWIDATQDVDDIQDEIREMLEGSHADIVGEHSPDCGREEWRIDDTEGLPSGAYREGLEEIAALACGIDEHGEAFAAWHGLGWADGVEAWEWESKFQDEFCGLYGDAGEYAQEMCCEPIPEWVEPYVDWAAMARDWELSGDCHFEDDGSGGVYVFSAS